MERYISIDEMHRYINMFLFFLSNICCRGRTYAVWNGFFWASFTVNSLFHLFSESGVCMAIFCCCLVYWTTFGGVYSINVARFWADASFLPFAMCESRWCICMWADQIRVCFFILSLLITGQAAIILADDIRKNLLSISKLDWDVCSMMQRVYTWWVWDDANISDGNR